MNYKKKTLVLVFILFILLIFVFIFLKNKSNNNSKIKVQSSQNTSIVKPNDSINSNEVQGSKKLTSKEVSFHKTKDDCWTIISNKVYNITEYVNKHPGGNVIIQACGVDATKLFTERKTNSGESVGTGTPHDQTAKNQLDNYFLGGLVNQ